MTRYLIHLTRAAAEADARSRWQSYYTAECARRGLRPGIDSLDRKNGRVLPLSEAVTTAVARVRIVADTPLVEIPGVGRELPEDPMLLTREELPPTVRAVLDAESQTVTERTRA